MRLPSLSRSTRKSDISTQRRAVSCACLLLFPQQAYEGLKTADQLTEQYVFIPHKVKDVYLYHLLTTTLAALQPQQDTALQQQQQRSQGSGKRVRSAIVFVSTCRGCQMLSLILRELGLPAAALHSGGHSFAHLLSRCRIEAQNYNDRPFRQKYLVWLPSDTTEYMVEYR